MNKQKYWALCATAPAIFILMCDSAIWTGVMMVIGGIIAALGIFSWWDNKYLVGLNAVFTFIVALTNGGGIILAVIFTGIAAGVQFVILYALIGAATVAGNT